MGGVDLADSRQLGWRLDQDSSERIAPHHASLVTKAVRAAELPDQLCLLTCDECCFACELEPLQDCVALVATQHSITSRGTDRPEQQTQGSRAA
jgi:hypothetical protein